MHPAGLQGTICVSARRQQEVERHMKPHAILLYAGRMEQSVKLLSNMVQTNGNF